MSSSLVPIPGFTSAPTIASLRFTLGTNIGAGQGMNSEVFLAHDHQLDTQVVIKKIPKLKISTASDYFAEARRLYDSRHKHVVEVKYACEDTDYIYFAMPFYRGGSLHSLMDRRYLTTREIIRYGLEFLAGLHHVHVKGLVHLDVKPTNVLLDESDTAAVADFGLSREVVAGGLAEMPLVYLRHMPPERAASPIVAKTTDIYQAGMTLYRMCVGNEELNRQFAAYSSKQALIDAITCGEFPNRNRRLAHVPVRLHKIVKTAMAENPTKRYQTVLELMNALAQVDEALDWAYAENGFWGDGTWHQSDGSRGRRVELMQTNGNWAVKATRRSATGREARFSVFSSTGLNERDARKLVSRALTQPWH